MTDIVLTSSTRSQLLAMQKTDASAATVQQRLATGRKINSALDGADRFFASRTLTFTASDQGRLLDGLRQNVQVMQAAQNGIAAISKLLEMSQAVTLDALSNTAGLPLSSSPLSQMILADAPIGYWRLNDGGGTAVNLGSLGAAVNGSYQGGVSLGQTALYGNGGASSASFAGAGRYVNIPDHNQINLLAQNNRTIEVVFNADSTAGRQVIWEEGGNTTGLEIYIFNGRLYFNGRSSTLWGPTNVSIPIVAGQTYHAALQIQAGSNALRGFLNGQLVGSAYIPSGINSHSGDIGIGGMNGDGWFHDGVQIGATGFHFNGRISDVAVYNNVISASRLLEKALSVVSPAASTQSMLDGLIKEIDQIARDSSYRGVNLLLSDLMRTVFNSAGSSSLSTRGQNLTSAGLGLQALNVTSINGLRATKASLDSALASVRQFSKALGTDFSILKTRDSMIDNVVNILKEGSDKLTLADLNEEGANIKALETAREMQVSTLALTAKSRIADLLRDLSLKR